MTSYLVQHLWLLIVSLVLGHLAIAVTTPGQPLRPNAPIGQFEITGNSIVSGQQIFLGTLDKVYVVDKTENNPTQIHGHPAWAAEHSISGSEGRPMDIPAQSSHLASTT